VSAIDAFYRVWADARQTFGNGTPQRGETYDKSAQLTTFARTLDQAAPGQRWTGAAAGAYAGANTEHQQVFSRLAELDRQVATHVAASAEVVAAGRRNLDALRDWVTAAAGSVPPGRLRDVMLTQIANKGLAELSEVVRRSNAESNTIAESLRRLGPQFDALGSEQRFGGKESGGDEQTDRDDKDDTAEDDGPKKTDMSSGDIEAIDQANRELLAEMRAEYEQLPDGQVKTDRLNDIAAIERALEVPGSHLVYLEKPDDPSQMVPAATSVGDPFTADHVSVTVPGVGSSTRDSIHNMTGEAAELRNEALDIADAVGTNTSVATVAWVGYQPPLNMGQGSVLNDDLAQAGASNLTSFLADLDAASHNPNQTTALFGHSYGSLTSGIALKEGASEFVDNAVLYGSPGFQATKPADLGMTDDNFFVMAAPDDLINQIGALAPLHGWGSDPNEILRNSDGSLRFRFQHLETSAGLTPIEGYEAKTGASGHSDYPRDAGERMTGYNLAAILLNRPDLAVKETPYGWH
jgi:hypothetical protein